MDRAKSNDLAEENLGRTPEALAATLRTSKLTSAIFDRPLPPMADPEPPRARARARYWLTRLYLSSSLVLTSIVIYLLPTSPTASTLRATEHGITILGFLLAFALLGVADVILCDLFTRCPVRLTRDHRHWIYNGQALAILALVFVLVKGIGWSPILLAFADKLVAALIVAPLDLFARHREEA